MAHLRTQEGLYRERKQPILGLVQRDLRPFLHVLFKTGIRAKREALRIKLCILLDKTMRSAYSDFDLDTIVPPDSS
jgi:hypothetical protein